MKMACLQFIFRMGQKDKSKNGPGEEASLHGPNKSDATEESSKKAEELLEELTQLTTVGFSKAAETKDNALHVACEHHYSDDLIINVLLKEDTGVANQENTNGDLPLHSAMKDTTKNEDDPERNGVSEKVLEALLSKNKGAVEHFNSSDCLPIHIACDNGAVNKFVVDRLLQFYPESVMVQSKIKKPFDATMEFGHSESMEESFKSCNESGSGLYSYFMDSIDNIKETFLKPESKSKDSTDIDDTFETNLTPLHLAIMNNASPDVIASLLNTNSFCLNIETSKGRTALDIAKTMPEAEDSIEIMESYTKNVTNLLSLKVVSQALISATAEEILKGQFKLSSEMREKKDPKMLWRKATMAVRFINNLTASLGPMNEMDNDESMRAPPDYVPPASLEMECVDITLPVGFRQLRWGLMSNKSTFYKNFHEGKMNFSEFVMGPWDKFDDGIGQIDGNDKIDESNFIGATRDVNYIMPKTMVVPANMAYTTETIVEYTNYCIAIKRVAKNPDVPFGKTFECHCLDIFINTGSNTCRMISTTEAYFYDKPPFVAWKIKNAMKNGVTEKSIALGESICDIRASFINFKGSDDQ